MKELEICGSCGMTDHNFRNCEAKPCFDGFVQRKVKKKVSDIKKIHEDCVDESSIRDICMLKKGLCFDRYKNRVEFSGLDDIL